MSVIGATEVKKCIIGEVHLLHEIPGFSAYEIAVKNGFKGTEAEWLASLKGEKGDIGTLDNHNGIDALGHPIKNVAEPESDTDGATKRYVDGKATEAKEYIDNLTAEDVGAVSVADKPVGTYTGDGSTTARTIDTGVSTDYGIVLIMGNGSATLVTYSGSISTSSPIGNNQLMSFGREEIKFVNGVITMQTADVRLNRDGSIYTWQVL